MTSPSTPLDQVSEADRLRPWWRYPMVWLVIGGPLLVVIAAIATAVIAFKNVDPVLDTSIDQVTAPSEAPAAKARNHAANPEPLIDKH
jgi:hypothetical protein